MLKVVLACFSFSLYSNIMTSSQGILASAAASASYNMALQVCNIVTGFT